jgi:hypothetical protein
VWQCGWTASDLNYSPGNGITPTGDPVQILDCDAADGPLIEAPSLILHDGTYVRYIEMVL